MNPAIAAVIAAQIVRAATRNQKGGGSPGKDGVVGTWGAFVWFVLVPFGLALIPLILTGHLYLIVPLVAVVLVTFPWPIAQIALIPLGRPKLAYWLTFTSDYTFRGDRGGGAAVAAAWALAMQPKPDEAAIDWVAAQLASEAPLRGAGVLASGLLLAARGDDDGARAMVEAVGEMDDRICPAAVRRLAASWLAADAAERGAWARVAELGQTLRAGGRLAWLLSGIAQSLLLEPMSPGRFGLWLRWAVAPRRQATLPLVHRALEALDGAFIEPEEEPPIAPIAQAGEGGDAFRTALSLHASVLSRGAGALRAEDVRATAQAWDAALADGATERRLLERALSLGASGAAATLERVRGAVEDDLAAVVLASGLPLRELGDHGRVSSRVRARLRDKLLSEVEAASDALKRRADDKRELPAADEWREWAGLCAIYERGVKSAGEDFRRLAFVKVYPDASTYSCWMFNERKERPLGNAIFRWLLREAEALDDSRAVALCTKNVACGV
jgi:hypothetical protein